MKRSFLTLGIVTAMPILGSAISIHAQNATNQAWKSQQMTDPTMRRQVTLHLENAKTSDQLLAIAKAGEFNVFADATFFSPSSPPVSITSENYLLNWILETANEERLSWQRPDERTLLFWKEPDVPAVAKALIVETQAQTLPKGTEETAANEPVALRALFSSGKMQEADIFLADYLQRERGWDGKSPLEQEFKLSELPPDAANELLSIARSSLSRSLQRRQGQWMQDSARLSDEAWQGARLLFVRSIAEPEGSLAVQLTNGQSRSLIQLDQLNVSPAPAGGQEIGETVAAQIAEQDLAPLSSEELSREAALAHPVSIDAKEVSLGTLLSQMQGQSGVSLKVSPNFLSHQRVAAFATALPLSQTMNALSGLYGVAWAKTPDGSYQMQRGLSPAQVGVLQVGDPAWFRYWRSPVRRNVAPKRLTLDQPFDWQGELLKAGVDEAALQTPGGVAFSTVPVELQSLIRRAVEETSALLLIRQYDGALVTPSVLREGNEASVMVRVTPRQKTAPAPGGRRPRIDTSPLLEVELVENGEAAFVFPVHGSQARQGIEEMVRRNHQLQNRMQPLPAPQQN